MSALAEATSAFCAKDITLALIARVGALNLSTAVNILGIFNARLISSLSLYDTPQRHRTSISARCGLYHLKIVRLIV
jgi:hypothetical protein